MSSVSSNAINPVISIITVVFNSRDLMEKTIQSVINQDYPHKEYIIIDGGSRDGTVEIIKRYQQKISFWKSEPDKGLYDAMNKGLNAATGDYVLFINSGDLLEENILSKIFHPGFAYGDVYYGETFLVDASGTVLGTRSALTTRKLPENLTWKDLGFGMVVSHQSIIVKKSIAPTYNLSYRFSADIDWVIRCLKNSKSIINTHQVISRFLTGGISSKNIRKSLKERFSIYVHHYGWSSTIFFHGVIVFKNVLHKLSGKRNY